MEFCRANMESRSDNRGKIEAEDQQQPPRRGEEAGNGRHQPPPPPRKCPRCDSSNTKFCYYNNYSLSQPRYFCKACRRYWTHGGTLRNVPVGGGCRRGKRKRLSAAAAASRGPPNSSPAIPSTNSTGMIATESSIRAFPPSMGNSVYSGGGFFPSLAAAAAAQSAPGAANHAAAVGLGGGGSHYGANMALLQGINLSSMMAPPPPPHQFQAQNEFNTPPRILTSYLTQGFLNRDTAAATPSTPGFWGAAASDGSNQAGSSFNPAQWSDHSKYHGFPPQQNQ